MRQTSGATLGLGILAGLLVSPPTLGFNPYLQHAPSGKSCPLSRRLTMEVTKEPNILQQVALGLQKAALPLFVGFSSVAGPMMTPTVVRAQDSELRKQLEALNKQVLLQEKLLKATRNDRLPAFPVIKNGVRLSPTEVKNAIERIRVLGAYLDEVERNIYSREWTYVPGFLGVVGEQEDAFIKVIEGLYPTDSVTDKSSRDALSYEAQKLYLELDNLREAARFQRPKAAERAYANIALAYDRFLKAGDLYVAYDPITSTEPFYRSFPQEMAIKYDTSAQPKITDLIVVLAGPDKGKTGKLIGMDDTKAVIKLDTNGAFKEVKMIPLKEIGKQQM